MKAEVSTARKQGMEATRKECEPATEGAKSRTTRSMDGLGDCEIVIRKGFIRGYNLPHGIGLVGGGVCVLYLGCLLFISNGIVALFTVGCSIFLGDVLLQGGIHFGAEQVCSC
ncbi:hypothetical protein B0H63DRAFT_469200 [Podospora didyma]|uniref:Uncharacterized protein n=1 Tax=Podospora didyma TaxID=330526 RepID=A0AAE0NT25_9PEZI|nr:hypothetical protein B0H63DRAFT_469200 [Podospora didyma]